MKILIYSAFFFSFSRSWSPASLHFSLFPLFFEFPFEVNLHAFNIFAYLYIFRLPILFPIIARAFNVFSVPVAIFPRYYLLEFSRFRYFL